MNLQSLVSIGTLASAFLAGCGGGSSHPPAVVVGEDAGADTGVTPDANIDDGSECAAIL